MRTVVFAFGTNVFPVRNFSGSLNLLFHKDGLFRTDGNAVTDFLCPITPLDWTVPELAAMTFSMPSALMRFCMHPSIVCQYAPDDALVTATTDYRRVANSIVILHKSILLGGGIRDLALLKARNNIVLFDLLDYTDERLPALQEALDGIILCSLRGFEAYSGYDWVTKPLFCVPHCIDTRLPERTEPLPEYRPLFHGAPENLLFYPSLQDLVPVANCYQTPQDEWLRRTLNASFFYALRPKLEKGRIKPFQKGFTAAQLMANILIHRDDGDALHYLGEDYPYLVHEDPTEEVVLSYLRKAKREYGGPEWNRGLRIMQSLKPHYAPATIAKAFWNMIETFR